MTSEPSTRFLAISLFSVALAGCWDTIEHVYDNGLGDCQDTGSGDADTDTDTDTDSDTDSSTAPQGQGDLPPGWEGFGSPCETDEDCSGYPGERRCIHSVMGIINVPGGYCAACCDWEEIDGCAENVDCVGANNVYVICLAHCDSDDDCRNAPEWECREIYYLDATFPGKYCLPKPEFAEVDTDNPGPEVTCPWPWS
jgi:hypothetical protein